LILRGKNLGFSLEDIGEYLALYDTDPTQVKQTKLLLEKVEDHIGDLQRKRADIDRTLRDLKDIRARCVAHLKRRA
jgi:DNA-binding transcriptional MerR regulator